MNTCWETRNTATHGDCLHELSFYSRNKGKLKFNHIQVNCQFDSWDRQNTTHQKKWWFRSLAVFPSVFVGSFQAPTASHQFTFKTRPSLLSSKHPPKMTRVFDGYPGSSLGKVQGVRVVVVPLKQQGLPSRELTYPTLGKRKIIFKLPFLGDMLVSWRVSIHCIHSN